jgi:hypothetical protein
MKTPRIDMHDLNSGREHLRTAVANVEHELSTLWETPQARAPAGLSSSWHELIDVLALGPAPKLRQCPVCGHTGMSDATRCGYCWNELTPLETIH